MLLDYGAGINVPDHYTKRPPVGWSWGPKRDPIHQFLIAKGAQVDTIRLACCIGDVDRVRAVLDADPALQSFKKRAAQADNGRESVTRFSPLRVTDSRTERDYAAGNSSPSLGASVPACSKIAQNAHRPVDGVMFLRNVSSPSD